LKHKVGVGQMFKSMSRRGGVEKGKGDEVGKTLSKSWGRGMHPRTRREYVCDEMQVLVDCFPSQQLGEMVRSWGGFYCHTKKYSCSWKPSVVCPGENVVGRRQGGEGRGSGGDKTIARRVCFRSSSCKSASILKPGHFP